MLSPRELLGANILISAPKPTQREVRSGSFATEAAKSAARPTSASARKLTSGPNEKLVAKGHVWTAPAVQEESDLSAKRSGAAMYAACFSRRGLPRRDAAAVAAGPDVIR